MRGREARSSRHHHPSRTPADDVATLHARAAMRAGGENGGDLDAAIEKLRARLAANPDDAEGWRLLAQSYEFLGRTAGGRRG